jgi:hypothetical protein
MNRWFNTAGPCQPEMHYMLPSMPRLPQLETLIDRAGYFVLHAPRQVGKTTAILTIAQKLTARGKYTAVMASAEVGATFLMILKQPRQIFCTHGMTQCGFGYVRWEQKEGW